MNQKILRCIFILLLPLICGLTVSAQNKEIRGRIIDQDSSLPLAGVTVTVKGSNVKTFTDSAGAFSIRVPSARAILLFSYVGYQPGEIRAGDGTNINLGLKRTSIVFDEVVVIGYGTVKKRDLTGSVSVVKAADIVRSPTSNPLEAIQGMVPGMDITKTSGKAGSEMNVQVRGTRTISGSTGPLYVIDGIQGGDINTLNPNDIESIQVLKDASSTAIYGSQGANGVVIVSTRKGTSGKAKVDYSGYYGKDGFVQYPQPRMGQSYIDLRREAYKNAGKWSSPADDATIFSQGELSAIQANQWVNWVDLLTRNGIRQSHSVSVSGGSDKSKAYLSAGYFGDDGMVKFNNLRQYNMLMNLEQSIGSRIKAGVQGALVYSRTNTRSSDPFSLAAIATPLGTPYDANGNIVKYPVAGNNGLMSPLSDDRGPLIATNNSILTRATFNVHLDVEPVRGLTFRTVFGVNLTSSRKGQFFDSSSLEQINGKLNVASVTNENVRFYDWDNILTYNKQIGDHSFTITGLTSYTHNNDEIYYAYGTGLTYSSQLFYSLGGTSATGRLMTSSYVQTDNMSYAGRLNYGYKGKYLLTLTERVDGASILSASHKWASFPSAAAAWRIGDESFMENVHALSNLKLRLSYGVAGNSGIKAYGTQSYLATQSMGFENTAASAYVYNATIGNEDLTWELSKTVNLGLDMGFLKGRVDMSVDLYNTNTSNILLLRSLPLSLGVSNAYQNVGTSRNRGVEVAVNSRNIDGPSFKWISTLSFMSNSERITGLINGTDIIDGTNAETNSLLIGHAIHSFYNYQKQGIWQTADSVKGSQLVFGSTPFKPGDIKLKDLNHDNKISPDSDRTYIGSAVPKWSLGFQNTFLYKGFDLTVYAIARWGQMIKADFLGRYNPAGQGNNGPAYFDYWTRDHPSNDYPKPLANEGLSSVPGYTTLIYVDGSYVKLKTVTLGYTLPQSMMRKMFMTNLRAYVTCNNIFVKAKSHLIKDYDPERGGSEDAPLSRQLVVGLHVGF